MSRNVSLSAFAPLAYLILAVLLISPPLLGCQNVPAPATSGIASLTAPSTQVPGPTITPLTPTTTPSATASPSATATQTPSPTITRIPSATPTPDIQTQAEEVDIVLLPGGSFEMGGEAATLYEECRHFREGCRRSWFSSIEPVHEVSLSSFFIDKYEVTNRAYAAFLNELGAYEGSCLEENCILPESSRIRFSDNRFEIMREVFSEHPAYGVTWYGAEAFCEYAGGRLPTEAEWEYAASFNPLANLKGLYPWGDAFDPEATNYCDQECGLDQADIEHNDGYARTAPVGSFEKGRTATGVYDMGGNVWEWVYDIFSATYYRDLEDSPVSDPQGPSDGSNHIVRGGSWFDTGNFMNALFRAPLDPLKPDDTVGFRCAYDTLPRR